MRGSVLILGSAQYSDRSWVNCQEIASRLSSRGHAVLFVDSIGLRVPRAGGGDPARIIARLRDAAAGVRRAPDGVWVASPVVRSGVLLRYFVRRALRAAGVRPDALIAYLPSWAPVVEIFPRSLSIYHCVDAFEENPGVDRARVSAQEARLLRSVSTVIAVSPPLRERLASMHPDVRYLPNVADVGRFTAAATSGAIPSDLGAIPRPRLLYLGNLAAYKIDLERIGRLAASRPEWSFVLVGPIGRGDPSTRSRSLTSLPNVHILGERERAEAPFYVAGADVCLLPLLSGRSTENSSPLKIYEYLASGHPIVATPIPAIEELIRAGLVRGAKRDEEWAQAIASAIEDEDPQASTRRRSEARLHGWDSRIDAIVGILGV
jgi:glycosyltransferase involved in cell wall biosynthesis